MLISYDFMLIELLLLTPVKLYILIRHSLLPETTPLFLSEDRRHSKPENPREL
jgi:hypothetical protein